MKPFTTIAALLFFVVAAAHAYRAYAGFDVTLEGHSIPLWGSYVAAAICALLGVMLIGEARR